MLNKDKAYFLLQIVTVYKNINYHVRIAIIIYNFCDPAVTQFNLTA